jgi:hypothetical protein
MLQQHLLEHRMFDSRVFLENEVIFRYYMSPEVMKHDGYEAKSDIW